MGQYSNSVISAVIHTPFKIWIILGIMILFGVRSLKKQVIYPPQLLLVPATLMCFKFPIFFHRAPYVYISMLAVGLLIGVVVASHMRISWQKFPKRLVLPGGPSTLWILCSFFCIKYGYGILHAIDPVQSSHWAWIDTGVSGLLPGYTWAKGLYFSYRYFFDRQKPLI